MGLFGPPDVAGLVAKGDVWGLIRALGYTKDAAVRSGAAAALGGIRDQRAVGPLLTALGDGDKSVRCGVAEALGRIGHPAAAPALVAIIRKDFVSDVELRSAQSALAQIGALAVSPLEAALRDQRKSVCSAAAETLARIGPASVDLLAAVMKERCVVNAPQAAQALGRIDDPRVVELLIWALGEGYSELRLTAAQAFGTVGTRAVEPLIAVLEKSEDHGQRANAARALGLIGDASAVAPLVELLRLRSAYGLEHDAAAEALGRIGDARAFAPLVAALKRATTAAEALVRLDKAAAVEPLMAVVQDYSSDHSARTAAVKSLVQLRDKRAIEVLAAAMAEHPDGDVADALDSLGWKPDRSLAAVQYWMVRRDFGKCVALGEVAVKPLIAFVGKTGRDQDRRWSTLRQAVQALGQIRHGDPASVDSLIDVIRHEPRIDRVEELAARGIHNATGPEYDNGYDQVRDAARDALVRIGDPAVEPVIRVLPQATMRAQWTLIETLGRLRDRRAAEPLRACLDNPSLQPRAERALASLAGQPPD